LAKREVKVKVKVETANIVDSWFPDNGVERKTTEEVTIGFRLSRRLAEMIALLFTLVQLM